MLVECWWQEDLQTDCRVYFVRCKSSCHQYNVPIPMETLVCNYAYAVELSISALEHLLSEIKLYHPEARFTPKLENLFALEKFKASYNYHANPAKNAFYQMKQDLGFEEQSKHLPGMEWGVRGCPSGQGCEGDTIVLTTLRRVIIHLNDVHRWTRDQIADWLESIHDPTGVNGPNLNFKVE